MKAKAVPHLLIGTEVYSPSFCSEKTMAKRMNTGKRGRLVGRSVRPSVRPSVRSLSENKPGCGERVLNRKQPVTCRQRGWGRCETPFKSALMSLSSYSIIYIQMKELPRLILLPPSPEDQGRYSCLPQGCPGTVLDCCVL